MFNLVEKAMAKLTTTPDLTPISGSGYNLKQVIMNVANTILWVAGAVAVIYLIYGGILYITSAGDEAKTKIGKQAVVNAVIGIAIIFAALLIIQWVKRLVNAGGTI